MSEGSADDLFSLMSKEGDVLDIDATLVVYSAVISAIVVIPHASPIKLPHITSDVLLELFSMIKTSCEQAGSEDAHLKQLVAGLSRHRLIVLAEGARYLGIGRVKDAILARLSGELGTVPVAGLADLLELPNDWSSAEEAATARLRNGLLLKLQ